MEYSINPLTNMNSNKELDLSFELQVQDLHSIEDLGEYKNSAPTLKQAVQHRNTSFESRQQMARCTREFSKTF